MSTPPVPSSSAADFLALARSQQQLRELVTTYLRERGIEQHILQRELSLPWTLLSGFLKQEKTLIGEMAVRKLCAAIGEVEFGEETLRLAVPVPKRRVSLILFSEETIQVVCDLIDYHTQLQPSQRRLFAAKFGPHKELVVDILSGQHKGYRTLSRSSTVRNAVIKTLSELNSPNYQREQALRTLVRYLDVLEAYFGKVHLTATALGVHRDTLRRLRHGEGSGDLIREKLQRAKQLIREHGLTLPDLESAVPAEGIIEEAAADTVPARSIQVSSTPSPFGITFDGIPNVLTPEIFQELGAVPIAALFDATTLAVQHARCLINVAVQIADTESRQLLQRRLDRELRELVLAIQLFGQAHPSALIEYIHAQREFWRDSDDTSIKRRK